MGHGEAIWGDWYSVAEPLNKYTAWLTFGISILWWALFPIQSNGTYIAYYLVRYLPGLIMGLLAGFFYMIILKGKIEMRNLENPTLIWLIICFVLSIPTLGGIFIWVQFVLVGILSDRPVWKLITERGYRYY